ncbi:DUF1592 domain-containing protein [Novipirellula artificiosorum]|uniref:DUF1592 domain-containing protein n=1 Tax=Novipirellula artificiosorum TaxID=2528016 RepID=UPI0018CCC555|nr:DUF1592 domain-containing protein [Novipirellula artificiosorum]
MIRTSLAAILLSVATLPADKILAVDFDSKQAFATYCTGCHGAEEQKGERRFDQLRFPIVDNDTLVETQDAIDQLVLGDMPPDDSDQPDENTRQKLIEYLRTQTEQYHQSQTTTGGETVLRRLNRREYLNTVRDLFQLNTQMFDPSRNFPQDDLIDHFDNVGNRLATTGFLLEQHLIAADQVIEKAFAPETKPVIQHWHFKAPFIQQQELEYAHREAFDSKYLCVHETNNSENHWGEYAPILKFRDGAPHHGRYEIQVLVEGQNRDHPHPSHQVDIDKDEPMLMGIIPGNPNLGKLSDPQPFETRLAVIEVPDGKPQWFTRTIWLDQGFSPRFTYLNGPSNARNLQSRIGLKMLKEQGRKMERFGEHYVQALKEGKLPHLRIHEIKIKGPIYDAWPPPSRQTILGEQAFTRDRIEEIVTRFMAKAYRRDVAPAEVDQMLSVARRSEAAGRTAYESLKDTLTAVLCAPGFLYLDEKPDAPNSTKLSDVALANRLSYFLWSSMPDDALVVAASEGSIRAPKRLRSEVDRMLQDPKASEFYAGFCDSWLGLRELGGMPPDRNEFSPYYSKDLRPLMLQETRLFLRHLVEENLSLLNCLDSDFTFVNRTLGRFYGMPDMKGYTFRKVTLHNKHRGGLLGHASVLTVTANGIETSPVTRGVWVLENLFGTPPSPPPDNVEPLDPDTRGTKTIREQLAKHRNVPACNECHRRIDPPGFALESYDPIGRWRTHYAKNQKIDASGQFVNGDKFEDIVELKQLLLAREDQFTRTEIEKLLVYGTGRQIEATDRPEIDRLVSEAKKNEYRFRDTLQSVIESSIFQSR